MKFGLPEATCATIRQILEGHPEVEKAVIYGSRAKGTHKNLRKHIDRVGLVFYERGQAGHDQGAPMKKG